MERFLKVIETAAEWAAYLILGITCITAVAIPIIWAVSVITRFN